MCLGALGGDIQHWPYSEWPARGLVPRKQCSSYKGCPGGLQEEGGKPTDPGIENFFRPETNDKKPWPDSCNTPSSQRKHFWLWVSSYTRGTPEDILGSASGCWDSHDTSHCSSLQAQGSPGTAVVWPKAGNFQLRWGEQSWIAVCQQ